MKSAGASGRRPGWRHAVPDGLGEPFTAERLTQLVRDYIDAADLGKKAHAICFGTRWRRLMLENGADIRFIQAMLGHATCPPRNLHTGSFDWLKEIHTATHPAKVKREEDDDKTLDV